MYGNPEEYMAQSTEEYLDSLLRQAMGVPEPEPEKKSEERDYDLKRDDVLQMADGLTGSDSAILGHAYDHNASFTNQGEISTETLEPAAEPQPAEMPAVEILPENMPDPDAPVAAAAAAEPVMPEMPEFDIPLEPILPEIPMPEPAAPEPVEMIPVEIPEGPVIEHDGSLDLIPQPGIDEMPLSDNFSDFISEPGAGPVVEPIQEHVAEPIIESAPELVSEPIPEPIPEAVAEPIPVPMPEFASEPITEPVPEAAAEPIPEPMPETAAEEPAAPSLSIDDLDQNDGAKALDPDMISALFESANAATDEPAAEPAEELSTEAPIAEEAVAEPEAEPIVEEVSAEPEPEVDVPSEEPAEESSEETAAPSLSIDDLDPNDSAKALDPDMIAALFESANAATEPAAEEAAAEEAAAEEAAAEEAAAEEAAADEPVAEEPVSEEASEDGAEADLSSDALGDSLEALDIPMDDEEESPLMPDQEITDLLSSLGELSGENPDEGEPEAEEMAAEEPAAEDAADGNDGAEAVLGGLDLFDTDLSAMLDDVTGSLENDAPAEGDGGSDDADLNDLLGSLDDGSGDLSDIGDLLNKDENSELVDPNTETAEALFASDSEEDLFNIDNLIDEEEPKGKKKGILGIFGLFGKKKKKGEGNVEVIGGDEEMLIDPDLLDIPDESEIKKKKGSFFANLFAKLFEEPEEEAEGEIQGEQSAVDIAAEGAAENEEILKELEGKEGAGKKGKKEKKKKEKKKDKKGASGDEEGEEGAEDTKKKKKEKKKKEKIDMPELPSRKLPRKKVVAIALFCITVGIVITFLAFLLPYSQDIKKAKKFYTTGEYQKTYEYMRGHKLTSEDQILYDRTVTLLRIKRPYDSYLNYMKMGLRMEALNALVQGVQMVDRYAEDAASLGIIDKYSKQSRIIYDELYNTFGVTVDKARAWIEIEGTPDYTRALYECLLESSGQGGGSEIPEEAPQSSDYEVFPDDGSVINVEENNL
ncbi:MAG: hypothetical protein K6F73_08245 [Lachnospiraceae bacterium]|nr:hypothetical protein [Lachnospiraceae bacterium]